MNLKWLLADNSDHSTPALRDFYSDEVFANIVSNSLWKTGKEWHMETSIFDALQYARIVSDPQGLRLNLGALQTSPIEASKHPLHLRFEKLALQY